METLLQESPAIETQDNVLTTLDENSLEAQSIVWVNEWIDEDFTQLS